MQVKEKIESNRNDCIYWDDKVSQKWKYQIVVILLCACLVIGICPLFGCGSQTEYLTKDNWNIYLEPIGYSTNVKKEYYNNYKVCLEYEDIEISFFSQSYLKKPKFENVVITFNNGSKVYLDSSGYGTANFTHYLRVYGASNVGSSSKDLLFLHNQIQDVSGTITYKK